jgi:hypothetical protein
MDHTTVHRVNIDELETHDVKRVANLRNPVTQKLVLEWKVDGVHPANLLELLENKPDGKIVFVDCQDAKGTSTWLRCHWLLAATPGCCSRTIT